MILIIDNYDSFVFNLARYVEELGYAYQVVRNNKISLETIAQLAPSHIILSPGPGRPEHAGICCDLIRAYYQSIPILGVCLGHQAIGYVFGATVDHASEPMHGKASLIQHENNSIFSGLPNPLRVGRYHSLIVKMNTLNQALEILARSSSGEVMAIKHKTAPLFGVQFHPESILTENGHGLLKQFLAYQPDKPCPSTPWQSEVTHISPTLSSNMQAWLSKPFRLMQQLRHVYKAVSITKIEQGYQAVLPAEQVVLDRSNHLEPMWVRHVIIASHDKPLIFGRTVIPACTYRQYETQLQSLKDHGLGDDFLFQLPQAARKPFEYNMIAHHDPLYACLRPYLANESHLASVLPARRSLFFLGEHQVPLLLTEVYLQSLLPFYKS